MPIGLGLLSLQFVADLISLATGREPPFGLPPKETLSLNDLPPKETIV
jgi:hypothetical protein